MTSPRSADASARSRQAFARSASGNPGKAALAVLSILAFVLWAHGASGIPTFRSEVSAEPGWERFRAEYQLNHFGEDGQFVRAVQNGYNLVFYTHKYAPRFTRKVAGDRVNACSGCHTVEDLAYGFVNSDRYDPKLARRVSFEERVQRCYARSMDGFVPTIYDPAVRDIRLLARAVAHHLQLSEGALRGGR
jgi:cytochrome c